MLVLGLRQSTYFIFVHSSANYDQLWPTNSDCQYIIKRTKNFTNDSLSLTLLYSYKQPNLTSVCRTYHIHRNNAKFIFLNFHLICLEIAALQPFNLQKLLK